MTQQKSLNRKTETVISLTVLSLIICGVAAVLFMQSRFDLTEFGVNIAGAKDRTIEAEALFPLSDAFEVLSPPENYPESDLYEKINGKAPLYTDAGFEMLDTQRFTFKENPQYWVEIYRYTMTSPQSAFCVYSTQKRPSGLAIDGISPEHGYKTTSGLYLAAGRNYFEINASAEDAAVLDALISSLADIAELDNEMNRFMPLPQTLPDENAVTGSSKLYLDGAFGIGGLGRVFIRDYVVDGQRLTAFTIPDGQAAMRKYEQFLEENGAEKTDDADGIVTYDLYGVYEVIGIAGDNLVGVHEADDADTGRELIKVIIEKAKQ